MGGGGPAAYAPERCSAMQSVQSATLQIATSRTSGAFDRSSSAAGPGSCSTDSRSRSASEMADTAAAEAAQVRPWGRPQNSCSPRGACDPGSLPAAVASADAHAVTSGSAADMAALLTAHRQIAMGCAASAEMVEVQGNLRACRQVPHSQLATRCALALHMWTSITAGKDNGLACDQLPAAACTCHCPSSTPQAPCHICGHTSQHPVRVTL